MKLGFNTNGLQNHRLDDALDLLAEHGYRAVALTLDVCHLDPFRATAAEVRAVARRLGALGLEPVIETGARYLLDARRKHEPTLMTVDPAGRARRLEFYGRAAAIGRDLGAGVVSFWSGIDRSPDRDSRQRLDEGVAAAAELIRERGLCPALEPEPGMAVATVAEFDALSERLGSEAPGLALDVGHLYVTEEDPAATVIDRLRRVPAQVHLEDIRRGVHAHLPPGEGDVDFSADIAALRSRGYAGPVCFELSRHSHAAPDVVAACAALWRRLG